MKRRRLALADDFFVVEDATVSPEDQARVQFVRNAEGVLTELRLVVADGRSFPRARERE